MRIVAGMSFGLALAFLIEREQHTHFQGMMTLFMTITGGINWEDCYKPLKEQIDIAREHLS